jgi:predicted amidophosphoribosyltransferase
MWRIFDMLFPPREDAIVLRSLTEDDFLAFMRPQLVTTTTPDAIALFPFGTPCVRAAIHEAKYHGSERGFNVLSLALAEYLRESDERMRNPILIPIPLGKERRKERRFNQIEEIGRRTANMCGIELDATLLVRVRETVSQVSLPRHSRKENMQGAFDVARPADPTCTYLIIDDVTTTGATLQAAIDALQSGGAIHIMPIALAH